MILVNGVLGAYLARGDRQLVTFLPDAEPDRSRVGRAVARVLIEEIDGVPSSEHPLVPQLVEAGFVVGGMGLAATFPRAARTGGAGAAGGEEPGGPSRPGR